MNDRITTSPPTCDSPSNVHETTSTTSSTRTSKRTMQEWTRSELCWSTGLLQLLPTQDGATQVDTPTTPSPAQVLRHRPFFDEPRVKTVMHLTTRYTSSIHKSKSMSKSLVLNQTKSLLLKLKKDNDYSAKKKKNERVYTKSNKL